MTVEWQDYFAPGLWNACCDGCGAKVKSNELRKDWQGFMKCSRCWESRHTQDFVRARPGPEPTPLPWVSSCSAGNSGSLCPLPVPAFTAVIDAIDPYTVHFTNTTYASETCPNTYLWDLGDGTTGTAWSFSHTFESGTFIVTLTAENVTTEGGDGISVSQTFTFEAAPPAGPTIDFNALAAANIAANPPNGTLAAVASDAFPGYVITGATLYNNTSAGTTAPNGPTGDDALTRPGFVRNRNPDGSPTPNIRIELDPVDPGMADKSITTLSYDYSGPQVTMKVRAYTASTSFLYSALSLTPFGWEWENQPAFVLHSPVGRIIALEFSATDEGFPAPFAVANIDLTLTTI